jgi:hypothetical protein
MDRDRFSNGILALILTYALLVAAFFVVRYGGRWMDTDTPVLSQAIVNVAQSGTLTPPGLTYDMGFGYQSLSVFILKVTGLPVHDLQAKVYPLLAALMTGPLAFVLFRALTGDPYMAGLATLVLFIQPDFLFVTFRGSHEKMTWALTMLLLYLEFKSLRPRPAAYFRGASYELASNALTDQGQPPATQLVAYVFLFYLTILALAATNVFFASSFISSIALSFMGGYGVLFVCRRAIFARLSGLCLDRQRLAMYARFLGRFFYIALSSLIILALVLFYLYPPAQLFIHSLHSLGEKLAVVLGGYAYASNPYQIVGFGWVSSGVYFALTLVNWLVVLVSLMTWLSMMLPEDAGEPALLADPGRFMLWLLYAVLALHVGIGMVADLSGLLGTNLQLRLFPAYMLVAIPMAVLGLKRLVSSIPISVGVRRVVWALVFLLMVWFSGASLLKVTNEPLLSNYWTFYTDAEAAALAWSRVYLPDRKIWADFDAIRLKPLAMTQGLEATARERGGAMPSSADIASQQSLRLDIGEVDRGTRDFVISRSVRLWSARNGRVLPDTARAHRVYDNGEAQIYHLQPRTPYQR